MERIGTIYMETEFQRAVGKGVGEVLRDIEEFLTYPCVIHPQKQIDLCTLIPNLNMAEQFSFALLSEALTQGWEMTAAESFYRHAVANVIDPDTVNTMIAAFRDPNGESYRAYRKKYGNRFTVSDGSYWSTCLALGIDAEQIADVMYYLRLFTVCLMEFAYMENRNPQSTYTWNYYESFRRMLDELTAAPEPAPLPLKIRALGGSAGKREGDCYMLSMGVDIENTNPDRMARGVSVDITLKDREGNVITVIKDQIQSIDPGAIYHYGVTRKIRGAATAGISAVAKASSHFKLSTPIMKHSKLSGLRLSRTESATKLMGTLTSGYDRPISALTLHYQLLSADNKIIGGGNEWIFGGLNAKAAHSLTTSVAVPIANAAKVVYSVDFDAVELVKE